MHDYIYVNLHKFRGVRSKSYYPFTAHSVNKALNIEIADKN